jgi:hypothetical protein
VSKGVGGMEKLGEGMFLTGCKVCGLLKKRDERF